VIIKSDSKLKLQRGGQRGRCGLLDLIERLEGTELDIVEVGSWIGESANLFASCDRVRSVTCVDSWSNKDDAEMLFDLNIHPKMRKVKAKSTDAAATFAAQSFDLVYIDASHKYENIVADIQAWSSKTRRYIGGHDYNYNKSGVIRAVFEAFARPHYVFMDGSWLVDLKIDLSQPKYAVASNMAVVML
jgi:hypothetical protein